jgi:DNA-binding response OmpR family regulator
MSISSPVILLVDDDPNDIFLMTRALRNAGVEQDVCAVKDGESAIVFLEKSDPRVCLVLLDIRLPRKSGFDVLHWIRAHAGVSEIPVVMISAGDAPQDRKDAERNGADAYQVKPVTFEELCRLARELRRKADVHCRPA